MWTSLPQTEIKRSARVSFSSAFRRISSFGSTAYNYIYAVDLNGADGYIANQHQDAGAVSVRIGKHNGCFHRIFFSASAARARWETAFFSSSVASPKDFFRSYE